MTIQECYEKLDGNYNEAVSRLINPTLVLRFALKFLNDTSFQELADHLAKDNTEEAFRSAHTLKGVCGNLAFTRLLKSSTEITELLRVGNLTEAKKMFGRVSDDYDLVVSTLKQL